MAEQALKSRHGCLTALLIVMMIANAGTALFYVLGGDQVRQALPGVSQGMLYGLAALALFNLVCTIALFTWKKWGFWGACASSIVAVGINLALGLGIAQSLAGLVGLGVLFGVLQIGDDKTKGWPQLD